MLVSSVWQTCLTVADRVCCEKHSATWSVTADVVNFLCFAVIGDRHVWIYASRVNWRTCFFFVFLVYVVLCMIVFGCQYQCKWLPGKTRLWNDLLFVEFDVKPYTLTHSLGDGEWKKPWWESFLFLVLWVTIMSAGLLATVIAEAGLWSATQPEVVLYRK